MKDKNACLKIRKIRKSMGLTQSQFAELVDMSDDSIGKIERCVNVPSMETLYKISTALKMPIETFLSTSKEKVSVGDILNCPKKENIGTGVVLEKTQVSESCPD
jgi:transcriptional regulator with XRE-family HTH domain